MSILTEVEEELVEEDRKNHKNILKDYIETRDRLRRNFYAAREKVAKIANMTTAEFKEWTLVRR